MNVPFPFKGDPDGSMAVELVRNTASVPPHAHDFDEFVLLTRGTCRYRCYGYEVPLIPGDAFLVPAHETHSYIIDQSITNYNVQFYPMRLSDEWGRLWEPGHYGFTLETDAGLRQGQDQIGVLRLNPAEHGYVSGILAEMLREQQQKSDGCDRVLRAYLEIILVVFARVRARQSDRTQRTQAPSHGAVLDALAYLETHFDKPVDLSDLAARAYLSPNYFRTAFKRVTGLSPVDYLNRLRIVKSLVYLRQGGLPVAEVAERVGFADANYFSRLFKRIVGYPPRYFKEIGE